MPKPFDWTTLSQDEISGLLERFFNDLRKQKQQEPEIESELDAILHPLTRGGS
jgi:hypothetical protein